MFVGVIIAFGMFSQQVAAEPVRCVLTPVDRTWQGTCAELFGENPTLTLTVATAVKSGRYRKEADPTAVYAGEMRIRGGAVPTELELYAGGAGFLRSEGLNWLVVTKSTVSAARLEFEIKVGEPVPPSDLDREIILRARSILSSEAVWDRADDRQCGPDDRTWSLYCALSRATLEVTGGIHHRRPAMEVVRQLVDERSAGRSYLHRLRDWNNDPRTTLVDVRAVLDAALDRMKR